MKEIRLTDAKRGEKLSNFQSFGKGDLVIADWAYGSIAGIEYLGGGVIFFFDIGARHWTCIPGNKSVEK
jgi:hypothetical protein